MLKTLIIFCSAFLLNICIDYNNIRIYLISIKSSGKLFSLPNLCRIWSFNISAFSFVFSIFILSITSGRERNVRSNLCQPIILYKFVLFDILFIICYQYLHLALRITQNNFLHSTEIVLDWLDKLIYLEYISVYSVIHQNAILLFIIFQTPVSLITICKRILNFVIAISILSVIFNILILNNNTTFPFTKFTKRSNWPFLILYPIYWFGIILLSRMVIIIIKWSELLFKLWYILLSVNSILTKIRLIICFM